VYFTVGTEPDNVAGVQAQLRQSSSVAAIQLTDAEQALQEFMAASADSSSLTAALVRLPENPLPATLQVSVVSDASLEELGALREQLVGLDGVDEVVIERTWLELLRNLTQLVERLGLILGVLFALGAVLVTAASVRLAIESRLEELRVLSLVGATRAQIRRPFLYFGVFYGLGGAVVAAMLLAITLTAIEAPLTALLGSYDIPVHVHGFGVVFLLTLLGVGMGLGVIGALVAVRQRIRGVQEMAH
jgi:cell division transport system permease protein